MSVPGGHKASLYVACGGCPLLRLRFTISFCSWMAGVVRMTSSRILPDINNGGRQYTLGKPDTARELQVFSILTIS